MCVCWHMKAEMVERLHENDVEALKINDLKKKKVSGWSGHLEPGRLHASDGKCDDSVCFRGKMPPRQQLPTFLPGDPIKKASLLLPPFVTGHGLVVDMSYEFNQKAFFVVVVVVLVSSSLSLSLKVLYYPKFTLPTLSNNTMCL